MMVIRCCQNCKMRTPKCHCTCKQYKTETEKNQEIQKKILSEKDVVEYDCNRPTVRGLLCDRKYK